MALYSFENVVAWQKAHVFTVSVYTITRNFPKEEVYGLTSQFRRAAVSIEANIAEGYKKLSKADKLRFFNISQGSLEECRNYILLTRDLCLADADTVQLLYQQLEQASWFLNKYCQGVINNNGVKDDDDDKGQK
ncbi:MAG: four helix bundle protein [Prevotella sp.]|nr:four helix bundle protein [Prevotella sp.]MBR6188742.1 four helix bundle protein [Prevotella sp.]